jgi:hypothetical protein
MRGVTGAIKADRDLSDRNAIPERQGLAADDADNG